MVFAANLSHAGIIEGVRLGRTVVMFRSRTLDPMLEFTANCPGTNGTLHVGGFCAPTPGQPVTMFVRVSFDFATVGAPIEVRLLVNNAVQYRWPGIASPTSFSVTVNAPLDGSVDRWRAQAHDGTSGTIRTMTNHMFVAQSQPGQH
jgi:hypothetical protein